MPSFNKRDAQRVGKVVKQFERDQFHPRQTNGLEVWNQNQAQNSVPVKVKSVETSGDPVKHSWVRVELDSSGQWTERPEWDKGGPDYSLDEASLIHPDGIAIEPSTIVLAHWSIDQGFLLAETDHVIAYKLVEPMTALNNEASAKAVDGDGNEYGPTIKVVLNPFLYNQFGPALSGWYGYAQYSPNRNSSSGSAPEYNVIYQMRFARYINWSVGSGLEDCEQVATVNGYWDGEEPTQAKVTLSCVGCGCYKGAQCGIAVFDESQSSDTQQIYQIVFIDQGIKADWNACQIEQGSGGTPVKKITFGRGLNAYPQPDCGYMVIAEGLTAAPIGCGESTPGSGGIVDTLHVESPLTLNVEPYEDEDCPGTAVIGLESDLITAEGDECVTLEVEYADCKYHLTASLNQDCIYGSGGSGSGCSIVGGSGCVSVSSSTSGGCTYYTVQNDIEIAGGEGIEVTSSGCVYTIGVRGLETGPSKEINFLCDVDINVTPIEITCVETSGGNSFIVTGGEITLDKTYGRIVLPQSILIDADLSGCGSGGGGSGGGGGDPPPPPPPDPDGECGIEVGGLDCESNPPGFFFTVDGMPAGANSYSFDVVGDKGSSATVGPSYDHEEEAGTYYGSLNQGWGDVQPGECFTITLSFEGSPCTSTWELCC